MNIFDSYTFKLLNELNKQHVEYIVVGGYAVNYHGYRRTTGDIDLWIKPENGINKQKILSCLSSMGISDDKIIQLQNLDFTAPVVFVDGKEPYKIDFMTYISGVKFDDAWDKKIIANIDGLDIAFIQFNQLVISKISNNRLKDKLDVEELQKIQELKDKQSK